MRKPGARRIDRNRGRKERTGPEVGLVDHAQNGLTGRRDAHNRRQRCSSISEIARSFKVASLANGNMLVTPKYRKGCGGLISRTALAMRIATLLNNEGKPR